MHPIAYIRVSKVASEVDHCICVVYDDDEHAFSRAHIKRQRYMYAYNIRFLAKSGNNAEKATTAKLIVQITHIQVKGVEKSAVSGKCIRKTAL